LLVGDDSYSSIWTLLDRDPGNRETKRRIYAIEAEVLDSFPDAQVDFKVINLAEYSAPGLLHIPSSQAIYQR